MSETPYVLEFGMGVDVHGQDSTTAAKRAVSDAIRHSSLPVLRLIREAAARCSSTSSSASPTPPR